MWSRSRERSHAPSIRSTRHQPRSAASSGSPVALSAPIRHWRRCTVDTFNPRRRTNGRVSPRQRVVYVACRRTRRAAVYGWLMAIPTTGPPCRRPRCSMRRRMQRAGIWMAAALPRDSSVICTWSRQCTSMPRAAVADDDFANRCFSCPVPWPSISTSRHRMRRPTAEVISTSARRRRVLADLPAGVRCLTSSCAAARTRTCTS